VNWKNLEGKTSLRVIVLSVLAISCILTINLAITGFAVYSVTNTTIEISDGENSTFTQARNFSDNYIKTQIDDGDYEWLIEVLEGSNYVLKMDYFFNTNYNETQPAKFIITADVWISNEHMNISIYNYTGSSLEYLNVTTIQNWQTLINDFSWRDYHLTDFINNQGKIMIVFEDKIKSDTGSQNNLWVDYLAINVTVSPLFANKVNLTNSTDQFIAPAGNWTRAQAVNVSAHWNASSVSVVEGALVLNNSNNGVGSTANASESPFVFGFSGNWTNFSLDFSNLTLFPVAGNYTVWMKAWDSFYQQNISSMTTWFNVLGHADASGLSTNETGNQALPDRPIWLFCTVIDSNSSSAVNSHNVSFYNESDYIGWNLTNASGIAVQSYVTPASNQTISCNITDQPGLLYSASPAASQSLTLDIISDTIPPVVNSVRFKYRNVTETNRTNLFANLTILVSMTDAAANATDVASATVNVSYPSGSYVSKALIRNQSSTDMWFVYFNVTNTDMPVNMTGSYSVNVSGSDLAGNKVWADWTNNDNANFTAFDNFSVTLDNYVDATTKYNRGEGLALHARDVNGLVMHGLNWTVNITEYGKSMVELTGKTDTANCTYFVLASGSTGNWTINVYNVTGSVNGVNWGNATFAFDINRTLVPYFVVPRSGTTYIIGQNMNSVGLGGPITLRVNYSRGQTANYSVNMTFDCRNTHRQVNKSDNSPDYINTYDCYSPNAAVAFDLNTNVTDDFNNTGNGSVRLSAITAGSPGGPSSSGGGPSGPSCVCNESWVNVGCGPFGDCPIGYMYQTRSCNPSGCDNETQCIRAGICDLKPNFNMTVNMETFEVDSGANTTAHFTFSNTGDANLTGVNLSVWVENDCCLVSFINKTIDLPIHKSTDQLLEIHPSLLLTPGEYEVKMTAKWFYIEKDESINVVVSINPILYEVDALKQDLFDLEKEIGQFELAGMDVSGLFSQANEIRELLETTDTNIDNDRLDLVEASVRTGQSSVADVRGQLTVLSIWRVVFDYKWWIALAVIVIIISSYVIFEIYLPLRHLRNDIKMLATKEKELVMKRKEIEVQYFQGKINQAAFNDMIIGEQQKILGLRGRHAEKVEERKAFVKERLSPRAIGGWMKSGLSRIFRRAKRPRGKPGGSQEGKK
jgi:hypothetical protein